MGSTVAVGSTGFQHIRVVLFENIDNFGLGFGFRGDFIPEPDCGCFDIRPDEATPALEIFGGEVAGADSATSPSALRRMTGSKA